jgi:hypothetical protein
MAFYMYRGICSNAGGELGGGGKGVVHSWVSQVVCQVLHWALSGHDGLQGQD